MNAEDVRRIGVIGAGLMGHGVALQFAIGGYDVAVVDTTDDNLRRAMDNVPELSRCAGGAGAC